MINRHEQAERAREFLHEIRKEMGITEEEFRQIPELLRWGMQYKRMLDTASEIFGKTIITSFVVGLAWAVWEGVKHFGVSK